MKLESPQIEENRIAIIKNIAANKREIKNLEDVILMRLNNSDKERILEDRVLMEKLTESKEKSSEITQQLETATQQMSRINASREMYKTCARKAAALFFVINDLNKINPMY